MPSKLQHALALARQGFYVFPLEPGSKLPHIDGWQRRASRDEAQIRSWWTCPVLGVEQDYNIGVSTSRFDDDSALLVVDVDDKGDKHGSDELFRLELEGCYFSLTFEQRTPTGGRHLVYRVPAPVAQGVNVLGSGLDIRSAGGFIVGPGSETAVGVYALETVEPPADCPEWIVRRCGKTIERAPVSAGRELARIDHERAVARAKEYLLNHAPVSIEGEGGDNTAFVVAAKVKDFGVDESTCVALMEEHWNERCTPPWSHEEIETKVANAYRYGREPVGAAAPEIQFRPAEEVLVEPSSGNRATLHPFDALNREFAFVLAGGGHHILWETHDAKGRFKLEHLNESSFHAKHAAHVIQVGKKTSPVTKEWMSWSGRRSYDGLCFRPGLDTPPGFYNLWRGFTVEPAASGSPRAEAALAAFIDHARNNVCHGHEPLFRWLMGYFAHMIQRPWEKPLVALVFHGKKGVGKNALVERVGALLGAHSLVVTDRRYLTGNFNGHLENCLLFALDEAVWAGDKQGEGVLKGLVTSHEHVIEHKGKEPYRVENRLRVVIIGNEEWLVPASMDERRWAVFNVGDARRQDRGFFQEMREGMEAGGYARLLNYDLTGIDVNEAPNTAGLAEQKIESMPAVAQWWFDCLQEGRILGSDMHDHWPGFVPTERLERAFRAHARERHVGKGWLPTKKGFVTALKAHCPKVEKARKEVEGRWLWGYMLPALPLCRKQFEGVLDYPVDWP
jgi:hypothetical protein